MSFFFSDAPEEEDILYGWEFDSSDGRYHRIYSKRHCAPFPRPAPSCKHSAHVRPLYVKHLEDHIDECLLECMFSPFGTVTGSKIFRTRGGHSKGFGFVWFANDREAADACYWMDGRPIESTELYVAPAEYREERQARLAAESGRDDDDWYDEEDDSYEDDDYYDDDDDYYDRANQAYYDDRNYPDFNHGFHQNEYPGPAHKQEPAPNPVYLQQQQTVANPAVEPRLEEDYYEDDNYYEDEGNNDRGHQACYDERNHHEIHQSNQQAPPKPNAYADYDVYHGSQQNQQPGPVPKPERAPKPVNQQQITGYPAVIVTEPRGPPPAPTACCCGTCNNPAQKLKLALAGCAAA